VGQRVGVSRARIRQLESSENIEISTLVRVASATGYKVQIALTSEYGKVILA
jgi:transcriptional regulator with XRE-family HTH domain